jgi:hypothetical protein
VQDRLRGARDTDEPGAAVLLVQPRHDHRTDLAAPDPQQRPLAVELADVLELGGAAMSRVNCI